MVPVAYHCYAGDTLGNALSSELRDTRICSQVLTSHL